MPKPIRDDMFDLEQANPRKAGFCRTGKVKYATRQTAVDARLTYGKRTMRQDLEAYECEIGVPHWHLGRGNVHKADEPQDGIRL